MRVFDLDVMAYDITSEAPFEMISLSIRLFLPINFGTFLSEATLSNSFCLSVFHFSK